MTSSALKPERTLEHWHEFNGEFQQHVIGKVVGYYNAVRALHLHCILFCRNNFEKLGAASKGKSSMWLAERVYVCGCVGVVPLSKHTRLPHIYEAMQIS